MEKIIENYLKENLELELKENYDPYSGYTQYTISLVVSGKIISSKDIIIR